MVGVGSRGPDPKTDGLEQDPCLVVDTSIHEIPGARRRRVARRCVQGLAMLMLAGATAGSAIAVRMLEGGLPLVALSEVELASANSGASAEESVIADTREPATAQELQELQAQVSVESASMTVRVALNDPADVASEYGEDVRWFNGRPVRPAKTLRMLVTGYSPDERSCPGTADGLTATLHAVETNGFRLVAADTRLLPFGSMLTIPGYDNDLIVPVLDRGGAIKGHRLDLLFETHEEALQWGRRWIDVTVWEYADGQPIDNPRHLR